MSIEAKITEEDIEWEDEDHNSLNDSLETIRRWLNASHQVEEPDMFTETVLNTFQSVAEDVLERPSVYDSTLYHGTQRKAGRQIIQEMEIRKGSELEESKAGEYGDLPKVSSTSLVPVAVFYAEYCTPDKDDIALSIENDILGRNLRPYEENLAEMKNIIGHHLKNDQDFLIKRTSPSKSELVENEKEYNESLRNSYRSLYHSWDRILQAGEDEGVVFGFEPENLQGEITQQYPLMKNPFTEENLGELRSDSINLDESCTLYIDEGNSEEDYDQEMEVGSIQGLKLMHMAKAAEDYKEGRIRQYSSPWGGKLHGFDYGEIEREFSIEGLPDLGSNPYAINIVQGTPSWATRKRRKY